VQVAMIGLGRMGANMARRLMRAGHECIAHDAKNEAIAALVKDGAVGAESLEQVVAKLQAPRVVWLMLPAAIVEQTVRRLEGLLSAGDVIVDGGNSDYRDAMRTAQSLRARQIHFVDVGTSGGVWGLDSGYCLMIGGDNTAVRYIEPLLAALAPGKESAPAIAGNIDISTAEQGYLHCGPVGAGHFVKMVHNGIEYGLMAAYAEGLNVLHHANRGAIERAANAETAPLDDPEAYKFDLNVPAIAELWRRGSVVRSWLLDLAAQALRADPKLEGFAGRVSDSGEGRWTLKAAVDLGVPAPTLAAALFARFSSQGEEVFADKLLSALRQQFGGHQEQH
jgi:6-phosphogluconate dehydrogenase